MRTIVMVCTAIFAAGCACNGGPGGAKANAPEDEARLATALAGRIAGTPQECVNRSELGGGKSFGRGTIVFGARTDDVVYVNRPPAPCPELGAFRALRVRATTTQLCRGDVVTVFDPVSGIDYGSCGLGSFTPYRRAR